jgi:hypothetical protein
MATRPCISSFLPPQRVPQKSGGQSAGGINKLSESPLVDGSERTYGIGVSYNARNLLRGGDEPDGSHVTPPGGLWESAGGP